MTCKAGQTLKKKESKKKISKYTPTKRPKNRAHKSAEQKDKRKIRIIFA